MQSVDSTASIGEIREKLKSLPECVFLERDEYSKLAISNRRLVRFDEPLASLHGVLDPSTGFRYLIESEKLYESLES